MMMSGAINRKIGKSSHSTRWGIAKVLAHILTHVFVLFGMRDVANAFTNGPEDKFFCGLTWDDASDCQSRQHCPTGRSEECEGSEEGVKCFANTGCDAKLGHGEWFVPGQYPVSGGSPVQSPGGTSRPTFTGTSLNITDHYWCNVPLADPKCGVHCPGGTSGECPNGEICFHDVFTCDARNLPPPTQTPISTISPSPTITPTVFGFSPPPLSSSPTMIPTEFPIGPPDPLPLSDDPTDYWFCGISLDDAGATCHQHCPTKTECPMGQICFFDTLCDVRTHSPTPPPTHRPTPPPTPEPTLDPTFTMPPTFRPSVSMPPSTMPTLPQPSKSPTLSPTKGPTYAPMPALMASFFCGFDWDDAITNCKRRCPSGESTECPFDEECFSSTPCTEELGYPEEFGLSNGTNAAAVEGDDACVTFTVTIVADNWPKETSWLVKNIDMNETIAEGDNENLVPGEPVEYNECFKSKMGCYEFTIKDTGGDGVCCSDGIGSYEVAWDGEIVKTGAAFYEFETTPFGGCGESERPTASPSVSAEDDTFSGVTISSGGNEESGDLAYRCVPKALLESDYEVSSDKCDLFIDCFNQHINVADDWFCEDSEMCVTVSACSMKTDENSSEATDVLSDSRPVVTQQRPTEMGSVAPIGLTEASLFPTIHPAPKTSEETLLPTMSPAPTLPPIGPCDGLPCYQGDHCRSQYGFCGPGQPFCNEYSIWTKDCPDAELSLQPSPVPINEVPPVTLIPTVSPSLPEMVYIPFSKPQGGGKKPLGGREQPTMTSLLITNDPTIQAIDTPVPTSGPTAVDTTTVPTDSLAMIETNEPTAPTDSLAMIETNEPSSLISSEEASDDFWSNTYSVSTPPSFPPENRTKDESHIVESANDAEEESCTGEPCPVTTHCRSRYGSCGPGFIYCNAYTIWKNTCPPSPPGTTFAQTPADSTSASPTDSSNLEADFNSPTMPPLAKPTLPTITKTSPFNISSTFSSTDKEPPFNTTNSFSTTDEGYTESGSGEENQQETSTADENANVFEGEDYLTEWLQSSDNSVKHCYLKSGVTVITLLLFIL